MYDQHTVDTPDLRATQPGTGPEASGHSYTVGSVIAGRYELLAKLGEGGMGDVFKALDRLAYQQDDPDPYVAVKILKAEFQRDQTAVKALQREANRALRLTHTNIVRIRQLEQDRETGAYFIVMELLEGRTVHSIMVANRHGQSWAQIAPYVEQICAGLEYAHQEGIVHCDIKPSNLFITRRGVVKILDFGIAVPVPRANPGRRETFMDSRKLGARTPEYGSLEMFLGHKADYSDDVYSLACVIHEWLSGAHPYLSRTLPRKVLTAPEAVAEDARPPRLAKLTPEQNKALRKALALPRARRTQTAADLWRSLSGPRRTWSPARITAGAASVVLASGLVLPAMQLLPARPIAPSLPEVLRSKPHAVTGTLPQRAPLPAAVRAAASPGQAAVTQQAPVSRVAGPAAPPHAAPAASPPPAVAQQTTGEGVLPAGAASRGEDIRMSNPLPGFARSDTRKRVGVLDAGGAAPPPARPGLFNAAQLGTALAGYYLGVVYQMSRDALPDSATAAASWMANAASQGKAKSRSFFDFIYESGWAMPTGDDLLRWLRWGGQVNSDREQHQGFLHTIGQAGVTRNDSEAAQWVVKAAMQGNASNRYSLAFIYDKTRGGLEHDWAQAEERWSFKPSQDEDAHARRILDAWGLRW